MTRANSKRRPWPSSSVGQSDSTRRDASADYICLYRGDREALSGSLDRIQRTASVILTGRQRRRITIASQRPAGASMVRRLGERLTIGQFLIAAAPRVAHGASARPPHRKRRRLRQSLIRPDHQTAVSPAETLAGCPTFSSLSSRALRISLSPS